MAVSKGMGPSAMLGKKITCATRACSGCGAKQIPPINSSVKVISRTTQAIRLPKDRQAEDALLVSELSERKGLRPTFRYVGKSRLDGKEAEIQWLINKGEKRWESRKFSTFL